MVIGRPLSTFLGLITLSLVILSLFAYRPSSKMPKPITAPKPINVPKYPPIILTPQPSHPPSSDTLKLLAKTTRSILKTGEIYSVTNSPVLCPEGKNWLFTLKPYWWEIDGQWVHRDGIRNPYCDAPQGQKQLETLSLTIRTLALASLHLPELDAQARAKAAELLTIFFVQPETRMMPEVLYAQCNPSTTPLRGDHCFVIAARYLLLVSQSLRSLELEPTLAENLRIWFQQHLHWMRTSEQGAIAESYGNNIAIWYHALIASHLAYLQPEESKAYALNFFTEIQTLHPTPAQYFARELERTRPRHYTLFTLEPTVIIAGVTGLPPPGSVLSFLQDLVNFARTQVSPSEIEVEVDNDERFSTKLRWFEKMLRRWEGQTVDENLDGEAWEGGWNTQARLSWGFV